MYLKQLIYLELIFHENKDVQIVILYSYFLNFHLHLFRCIYSFYQSLFLITFSQIYSYHISPLPNFSQILSMFPPIPLHTTSFCLFKTPDHAVPRKTKIPVWTEEEDTIRNSPASSTLIVLHCGTSLAFCN